MRKTNSTRVKAPDSSAVDGHAAQASARMTDQSQGQSSASGRNGLAQMRVTAGGTPSLDLRSCTRFATWNVLTLNGVGYQSALVHTLRKHNTVVAGITEARLPGSDLSQVEGATIIQSGGQDHTAGVALVLQPPFNKALVSWRSVSSRLLHARLSHRHGHVSGCCLRANRRFARPRQESALQLVSVHSLSSRQQENSDAKSCILVASALISGLPRTGKQQACQALNQFQIFNFTAVVAPLLLEPKTNQMEIMKHVNCMHNVILVLNKQRL